MYHLKQSTVLKRIPVIIFFLSVLFYSTIIFKLFPTNISFKYQVLAQQYSNNTIDNERLLDVSPLYFYVHVAARKLSHHSNVFILWVQIVLSAFSSVFLFHILRSFFTLPISLLGTLAFVTNRSVVLYTSTSEPEAFMIFFLLGFLVFSLTSHDVKILVSGIFLGFSLLTRSNFLPLLVITPIFFWLTTQYRNRLLRRIILFEIPIIMTMSLLIVRNTAITGSFTPFSMNPGTVFFEGNNPNSTGESAIYPPLINEVRGDFDQQPDFQHVIYRIFARRIEDTPLAITDINSYWSQKARNFICDHPAHFLTLLFIKTNFFFHNFRRHDLSDVYWNDQKLQKTTPTIPYALISALGLIGMVFSRKTWKKKLLIYAVFFSQFGIILLTYASDRQRVAIIACMIFFASEALNASVQKNKYLLLTGLVTLVLFPFLYMKNDLMKDDIYTWNRYALSNKFMREARQERENGNLPLASEKNVLSFALAPGFVDDRRLAKLRFTPKSFQEQALKIAISSQEQHFATLFDLAVLSIEAGQFTEAEAILHDLVERNYQFNRQYIQSSQPYFYLSRLYTLQNNRLKAIASLEKALQNNPGDPWVLSYLASLTNDQRYKNKLFRYFDAIDAEFFLGRAYLETGRFEEAVKSFSYVVEKIPEYRKGIIYLSIALGATGNYEQAVRMYLHAIKKRRDPIFREEEVLTIFRKWAEHNPQNAEATYYLGVILREFGYYKEALKIQQKLLEKYPSRLEVKKNIDWLKEALERYSHQ